MCLVSRALALVFPVAVICCPVFPGYFLESRPWVLGLRVNPNSLSYPFPLPLPLSFARSREHKGCPNSRFDRGVGLRGRGRYPLKPTIFASLLETKGYPEYTVPRSSRESHKCKYFRLK